MTNQDIIDVVALLNDECFDQTFDCAEAIKPFEFQTDGSEELIMFLGQCVWSSNNEGSLEFRTGALALLQNISNHLAAVRLLNPSKLHALLPPIPNDDE